MPDFIESVYEKALTVALAQKGLKVVGQVRLNVKFRGVIVGEFCADMLVEDRVIVELKPHGRSPRNTRLR